MTTLYLVTRGDCNAGDHEILAGFTDEDRAESYARSRDREGRQDCTIEEYELDPAIELVDRPGREWEDAAIALGVSRRWASCIQKGRADLSGRLMELHFQWMARRQDARAYLDLVEPLDLGGIIARPISCNIEDAGDPIYVQVSLVCDRLRRKSSPLPASV